MKYCCTSPIMRSANSVEKMQVFCAWSSFRMSACTVPRTACSASARMRSYTSGADELVAGDAEQREPVAVVTCRQIALVPRRRGAALLRCAMQRVDLRLRLVPAAFALQVALDALIDRRVHEHREDHRRRAVDGHRHRGGRAHRSKPE